jgi:peptidase M23-like protein
MFPLKKRELIRGCAAHIKAGLGCGADYEAVYINDYVPFDGNLQNYWGTEGGNWCRLTRPNGDRIEMAHHSKFLLKNGPVKEGQLMAVTGNTGSITTRPHLHIQIFNKAGQRLDPEKYNWEKGNMGQVITQAKGPERRIVIKAIDENWWNVLCAAFGKDPNKIDEQV